MSFANNKSTKQMVEADLEPSGPTVGLVSGDDSIPTADDLAWLPLRAGHIMRSVSGPHPDGYYLLFRRQCQRGVVEDRWAPLDPPNTREPYLSGVICKYRGYLKDLKLRRFFLCAEQKSRGPFEARDVSEHGPGIRSATKEGSGRSPRGTSPTTVPTIVIRPPAEKSRFARASFATLRLRFWGPVTGLKPALMAMSGSPLVRSRSR